MILERLYEWLFSEEERQPIGFIPLFLMIIIVSSSICLVMVTIDRHVQGIVRYLFQ